MSEQHSRATEGPDLVALLKERGLTQTEVSRRMGLAIPHLHRMVQGKRPFPLRYARAFSLATGIPLKVVLAAIEQRRHD